MCDFDVSSVFDSVSTADVISTAGTLIKAGATIKAGQQQAKQLEQQAATARKAGKFEVDRLKETAEKLKSRQRVAVAKSGVKKTGSALEVMRQSAQDAEEEALNIQFGAESGAQARLFEAKQLKKAGKASAVTTLLSGFGE